MIGLNFTTNSVPVVISTVICFFQPSVKCKLCQSAQHIYVMCVMLVISMCMLQHLLKSCFVRAKIQTTLHGSLRLLSTKRLLISWTPGFTASTLLTCKVSTITGRTCSTTKTLSQKQAMSLELSISLLSGWG